MQFSRLALFAAAITLPVLSADFTWSGSIALGKAVEIKGVNGSITAAPSTSGKVEVSATKTARRSDPSQVKVEVVEHPDGVTICAVYPSPDSGQPNECKPGSGGRMSTRDNDTKVDFVVKVPAGDRLIARTVNGKVDARLNGSDVEAHTVNGSVEVEGAKTAKAKTVNGSIEVQVSDASREMSFETVNGSVEVTLPANARAELDAKTVNGDISSDLPLTVRGTMNKRHVSGSIGGPGGPALNIKTVNGGVTIRSGRV
jgi:hypothetical protein